MYSSFRILICESLSTSLCYFSFVVISGNVSPKLLLKVTCFRRLKRNFFFVQRLTVRLRYGIYGNRLAFIDLIFEIKLKTITWQSGRQHIQLVKLYGIKKKALKYSKSFIDNIFFLIKSRRIFKRKSPK